MFGLMFTSMYAVAIVAGLAAQAVADSSLAKPVRQWLDSMFLCFNRSENIY